MTGKSSDVRAAKRFSRIIHQWVAKENPNVLHFWTLFKAEAAALVNKIDVAESLYQKAFALASRSGCLHEAALMSERYANFLLTDKQDSVGAKARLEDALKLYKEWGAGAKVMVLREEIAKLDNPRMPRPSKRFSLLGMKPLKRVSSTWSSISLWSTASKG